MQQHQHSETNIETITEHSSQSPSTPPPPPPPFPKLSSSNLHTNTLNLNQISTTTTLTQHQPQKQSTEFDLTTLSSQQISGMQKNMIKLQNEQNKFQQRSQKEKLQKHYQIEPFNEFFLSNEFDFYRYQCYIDAKEEEEEEKVDENTQDQNMNDQSTYCQCHKSYSNDRFMIACDGCEEQYHGQCVGIIEKFAVNIEKYFCFNCSMKMNKSVSDFDYIGSNDSTIRCEEEEKDASVYCNGFCEMKPIKEQVVSPIPKLNDSHKRQKRAKVSNIDPVNLDLDPLGNIEFDPVENTDSVFDFDVEERKGRREKKISRPLNSYFRAKNQFQENAQKEQKNQLFEPETYSHPKYNEHSIFSQHNQESPKSSNEFSSEEEHLQLKNLSHLESRRLNQILKEIEIWTRRRFLLMKQDKNDQQTSMFIFDAEHRLLTLRKELNQLKRKSQLTDLEKRLPSQRIKKPTQLSRNFELIDYNVNFDLDMFKQREKQEEKSFAEAEKIRIEELIGNIRQRAQNLLLDSLKRINKLFINEKHLNTTDECDTKLNTEETFNNEKDLKNEKENNEFLDSISKAIELATQMRYRPRRNTSICQSDTVRFYGEDIEKQSEKNVSDYENIDAEYENENETSFKIQPNGGNLYTAHVDRCLRRLTLYPNSIGKLLLDKNLATEDFVCLDSKQVNALEKAYRRRRKCRLFLEEIIGKEFGECLENLIYIEFGPSHKTSLLSQTSKGSQNAYGTKYRELVFNLKNNTVLIDRIKSKELGLKKLVRMSDSELASQELAKQRDLVNKEEIRDLIRPNIDDTQSASKNDEKGDLSKISEQENKNKISKSSLENEEVSSTINTSKMLNKNSNTEDENSLESEENGNLLETREKDIDDESPLFDVSDLAFIEQHRRKTLASANLTESKVENKFTNQSEEINGDKNLNDDKTYITIDSEDVEHNTPKQLNHQEDIDSSNNSISDVEDQVSEDDSPLLISSSKSKDLNFIKTNAENIQKAKLINTENDYSSIGKIQSGKLDSYSRKNVYLNSFDIELYQIGGPLINALPHLNNIKIMEIDGLIKLSRVLDYIKEMFVMKSRKIALVFEVRPLDENITDDYNSFCTFFQNENRCPVIKVSDELLFYLVPPDSEQVSNQFLQQYFGCNQPEGCLQAFATFSSRQSFLRTKLETNLKSVKDNIQISNNSTKIVEESNSKPSDPRDPRQRYQQNSNDSANKASISSNPSPKLIAQSRTTSATAIRRPRAPVARRISSFSINANKPGIIKPPIDQSQRPRFFCSRAGAFRRIN